MRNLRHKEGEVFWLPPMVPPDLLCTLLLPTLCPGRLACTDSTLTAIPAFSLLADVASERYQKGIGGGRKARWRYFPAIPLRTALPWLGCTPPWKATYSIRQPFPCNTAFPGFCSGLRVELTISSTSALALVDFPILCTDLYK